MAKVKGIYKRGNIYWIRYAGLDGKTIFESTHSDKFETAKTLLTKRHFEIDSGKQPDIQKRSNTTFKELSEEYKPWCKRQKGCRQKSDMIRQLVDIFGNLPLRSFNTILIDQFQSKRIEQGNKPATVNRLVSVLKHMFTKAEEWGMIGDDTLRKLRKAKQLTENNRRLRYLSKEEIHVLIESCEPHLKPIVTTALNTGMRKGEILSLKWSNVDLKHGFILLDVTKNGERREIPINSTLRAVLQGMTRRLDIPYVFFDHETGTPYKDVKRSFSTALKRVYSYRCVDCNYQKVKAKEKNEVIEKCPVCGTSMSVTKGIQDFRFHDQRHTFASHLVMSGADLITVKELLGHKDIKMTLRYAHLAPSHKVKALEMLDRQLQGEATIQKLYNSGAASHV